MRGEHREPASPPCPPLPHPACWGSGLDYPTSRGELYSQHHCCTDEDSKLHLQRDDFIFNPLCASTPPHPLWCCFKGTSKPWRATALLSSWLLPEQNTNPMSSVQVLLVLPAAGAAHGAGCLLMSPTLCRRALHWAAELMARWRRSVPAVAQASALWHIMILFPFPKAGKGGR